MRERVSIHDVAAAAGVSVATVSKAVNGRYGVAPETAARVMAAVAELGYASSLIASSMRSHRTGVIGVLVAGFEPFSAEILKGVGEGLRETHYDLLAYSGSNLGDGQGWERRSLSRLSGTLIDGAIMVTPTVTSVTAVVPIVAVDPHTGRGDLPTAEADSRGGARQAVDYLLSLGHRRIGFVAGRPDLRSAQLRDTGYRDALAHAGISYDPSLTRVGFYDSASAREAALSLLRMPNPPTAVFSANDLSAIALMEVAHELGLAVPRDLSVVGFDDIPEAAQNPIPLTTVRQPMQRLGQIAAEMLTALMAGEALPSSHVLLPTRLVVRASTAPPR